MVDVGGDFSKSEEHNGITFTRLPMLPYVAVVQNLDDPTNLEFCSKWDSKEHYEKYLQWRVESGVLEDFSNKYVLEEPVWRYFDLVSEF